MFITFGIQRDGLSQLVVLFSGNLRIENVIYYVSQTLKITLHRPWRLLGLVLLLVIASAILILLVWMVVTPFSYGATDQSLMPYFSKQWEWDLQDAHMRKNLTRLRTVENTEFLLRSQYQQCYKNKVQDDVAFGSLSQLIPYVCVIFTNIWA